MKAHRYLLITFLASTCIGCTRPAAAPTQVVETFANVGRVKGQAGEDKTYIGVFQLQHGDQLAQFILGQLPGEDPAPMALLLFRLPDATRLPQTGATAQGASNLAWRGSLPTARGQKFQLAYEITYKPTAADELQLGGQKYAFDSGRFFLIDLTQDPVTPVQLKEKVVPLLPSSDPTEAEFKTALETLKARQEKVRAFLDTPR
jgi:hypothetical protein